MCVEWCYAKKEDGRFGDQKYLDDWPERFLHSVHVLAQRDFMQAPWNAIRFPYSRAVAYHFHGLRLIDGSRVLLAPNYSLPKAVVENVYRVYLEDFAYAIQNLRGNNFEVRVQAAKPSVKSLI